MSMTLRWQQAQRLREEQARISKAGGDKDCDAKPTPGLQVQTTDQKPVHGIYEHKIAGRTIGHTAKVVANGSISWTAVPANGNMKGGFKQHDDAKQYLADQHGATLGQEDQDKKNEAMMQGGKPGMQMKKFQKSDITTYEMVAKVNPVGLEGSEVDGKTSGKDSDAAGLKVVKDADGWARWREAHENMKNGKGSEEEHTAAAEAHEKAAEKTSGYQQKSAHLDAAAAHYEAAGKRITENEDADQYSKDAFHASEKAYGMGSAGKKK